MKIPKFLEDLAIISKLGDNPGADNGLTPDGLKAKFDEGVLKLQNFINTEIVDKFNSYLLLDAPFQPGANMTGPINMNGQPLSGLNPPTEDTQAANMGYVNAQVRKAAPRNLLDNSDFTNPVNQRGQTTYTTDGYTIDRWCLWVESGNLNFTVNNGYISLSFDNHGTLYQRVEKGVLNPSKTYTLAYKKYNGGIEVKQTWIDYEGSSSDVVNVLDLKNGEVVNIEWVALYEGEYTLDTLPEYQPKGYGAELAECMRYFRKINSQPFVGHAWSNAQMGFMIPGIAMRKLDTENNIPSIYVGAGYFFNSDASGYFASDANVSYTIEGMDNTGIKVIVTDNSERFMGNNIYAFKDAYITIFADL